MKVCLPTAIYDNILESFQLFLDALKPDLLTTESRDGVEQLLRLLLFSKLFNVEVPSQIVNARGKQQRFVLRRI